MGSGGQPGGQGEWDGRLWLAGCVGEGKKGDGGWWHGGVVRGAWWNC
jgi:hypothetical protein